MDKIETLTKILQIRENEKNEAQLAHTLSVDLFEEVATKLYTLLKRKEKAEQSFTLVTKKKTSIETIKEQAIYIENLQREIMKLQKEVSEARHDMEAKRGILTEAHVEMKKFEKMIELREQKRSEQVQKIENNSMDEISIQQYLLTIR